jgi:hypothetical protein
MARDRTEEQQVDEIVRWQVVVSDDLIAFLKARLDEGEETARRNIGAGPGWQHGLGDTEEGLTGWPDYQTYDGDDLTAASEYLNRFRPLRTLRDIEAKRRRLALYLDAKETLAATLRKAPPEGDPATAHSYVRERINVNSASGRFAALEMSVRLDAMAYSDHPDYRQEWKP